VKSCEMDVVGSSVRHQGTSLQLSGPGNQSLRKAITEKDDKSSGVAWMSPFISLLSTHANGIGTRVMNAKSSSAARYYYEV
jgi:hypothetical protein